MQNFLEEHRGEVRDGVLFVPAGDGKTSFVDARDVAEVAAAALTEPGHGGRAYDVTGPEALTYDEVAAVFSDVGETSRVCGPVVAEICLGDVPPRNVSRQDTGDERHLYDGLTRPRGTGDRRRSGRVGPRSGRLSDVRRGPRERVRRRKFGLTARFPGLRGTSPPSSREVTHADWTASNFDSGPPLLLDGECGRHVRTVREGVDEAPVEVGGRPVGLDHHRPVVDVVARPADETPVAVER